jgi:rod shape-determining protein MreD
VKTLATIVVAVLLQMVLARYMLGGIWVFDMVLVGTVYAAIIWGPTAGMLAGTVGGLVQDALSDGVVGVGALSKTLVGFGAGVFASQFVVTRSPARMLLTAASSFGHRMLVLTISAIIVQRWSSVSWAAVALETCINTLAAFAAFYATEGLPNVIARGKESRRPTLSRRQW